MKNLLCLVCFLLATSVACADIWDEAVKEIKYLEPSSFKQLPKHIVRKLEKRSCKIPQIYANDQPHNVINGEFAIKGQNDWVVLCSKNSTSVLLVFWGGSMRCTSEIGKGNNRSWLQGIGSGEIGYSRLLSSAGEKKILEYHEYDKVVTPPSILHQGIDEYFYGKASSVHYCYKGNWVNFSGAD